SALPTITEAVTIDGYSQSGASANTLTTGDNAVLLVELNGTSAGSSSSGLTISASGSMIKGLVINRFATGITLSGAGATGNTIAGNFIGTDPTGTIARANTGNGITIASGSSNNLVGTNGDGQNDAAERNIISGNTGRGIIITDAGTNQNVVAGNFISV